MGLAHYDFYKRNMTFCSFVKYYSASSPWYEHRDTIDPILLNEIDGCSEWLVGKLDGDANEENKHVFGEIDNLTWKDVASAFRAGEARYSLRSQST